MFVDGKLTFWTGITSLRLQNAGAFFGIYAFSRITQNTGAGPRSPCRSCWRWPRPPSRSGS